MKTAILLASLLLAACQEQDPSVAAAQNGVTPERLEAAAAQSDSASAAVLENAADEARSGNSAASAQDALATAGNATEAEGVAMNRADTAGAAPPPQQAQPNYDGQRKNFDEKGKLQPRPKFIPPNAQ